MRLVLLHALLLALIACSGPISPPIGSHIGTRNGAYASSGGPYSSGAHVMRPPPNAPPDPIGTTRPGDRSCTEDRDCRPGSRCFAPDYTPPPPVTVAPAAPVPPGAAPAAPGVPTAAPLSGAPGAPPAPSAASGAAPPPAGSPLPAPSPAAPPTAARPPAPPGATQPAAPMPPPPAGSPPTAPGAPSPAPIPGAPGAPAATPIPLVCQTDPQCGNGLVCEDGRCSAPCNPTSCPPDRECHASGHCRLIPCTDPRAGICPLNSRCNASNGVCERQVCTTRAQCDSGTCFRGRCYSHDAYCLP